MKTQHVTKHWWKEAVAYQVYPRSFYDSNGDGIGDLNGITEKLDYLKDLGVDVIWICPMYKSPNDDNGYDISDYQDIMDEFGNMADFDRLLTEVHRRGMRLILDLVVNHTSDEHPWFIESRSSKNNPKRDWYVWRDGKNGQEPNNWESIFKGSAWKYDAQTEQYFLHLFSTRQPDLNWENQEVRTAIYDMIHWWLKKGIDGFRIDAISHMKKEPEFSDMPNPDGLDYVPSFDKHLNYEGVLDYLDDLSKNTFNHYDIMTVGEANGVNAYQADEWVSEKQQRLNMIFQFEHVKLWERDPRSPLNVCALKKVLSQWQDALYGKGWNALYVENHDITRVVSKWGSLRYWRESATAIAAMYFLMQGTPFIYQGQEIGMTNTVFDSIDDFDDIWAKNRFAEMQKEGYTEAEILELLTITSRDNARTPMQWNAERNAGFTTGNAWLKLNPNYHSINVEAQLTDQHSVLNFYRRMAQLRKREEVLIYGKYDLILADDPQIYAYSRTLDEQKILVICNLSDHDADYLYDDLQLHHENLLLSNYEVLPHSMIRDIILQPFETRVYRL